MSASQSVGPASRRFNEMSPQDLAVCSPKNKVRFVTATALFDGHDASINIMRRLLQARGAEVVHHLAADRVQPCVCVCVRFPRPRL